MADLSHVYTRPLCPLHAKYVLRREFDMSRYLDLDGATGQFDKFREFFTGTDSWSEGNVIVAEGEKGSGKTSLIQRCAAWLAAEAAETGQCDVVAVDLLNKEGPPGETREDRMNRTLEEILAQLGSRVIQDERDRIALRAGAEGKFRELGEILLGRRVRKDGKDLPLGVMVLLDGYPRADDVQAFYRIAGKGMLFFAEIFDEEQRALAQDFENKPWRMGAAYRILSLGALNHDDPDKFVSWVNSQGCGWPRVRPEISEFFKEEFIPSRQGVGQMAKIFWGALDIAIARKDQELNMGHIASYVMRSSNNLN